MRGLTMDLIRTLNSIGKSAFVKYYYTFKEKDSQTCLDAFEENYAENGKRTRVNCAKRIFQEHLELEALKIVINASRVDEETRRKATEILNRETM